MKMNMILDAYPVSLIVRLLEKWFHNTIHEVEEELLNQGWILESYLNDNPSCSELLSENLLNRSSFRSKYPVISPRMSITRSRRADERSADSGLLLELATVARSARADHQATDASVLQAPDRVDTQEASEL
ncbi:hypothetical protein AKJ16_DCAP02622 [Drosera capensis]